MKNRILTAYGKRQKEWLSDELLHSSPKATFRIVDGRPGAQLEHPKGGPLGWVQSPFGEKTLGVFWNGNGKWEWLVKEEYVFVEANGNDPAKIVIVDSDETTPEVRRHTLWKHHNGRHYLVKELVNQHTTDHERYPVSVVYVDLESEHIWCRPLSDWHRSMMPL